MRNWKQRVIENFDGAVQSYDFHSDVQQQVANRLAEFLLDLEQPKVLEIGCGTGVLTKNLFKKYPDGEFQITDISPLMVEQAKSQFEDNNAITWSVMDGENPACGKDFDLIISNMTFQWFEDVSGALEKLKQHLKQGGKIYYSVPGPLSFKEWQSVLDELGLESGVLDFKELPGIFKEETIEARYKNALSFLRSIKDIGAHTPNPDYKAMGFADMRRACEYFDRQYNGRVSWHILYGKSE